MIQGGYGEEKLDVGQMLVTLRSQRVSNCYSILQKMVFQTCTGAGHVYQYLCNVSCYYFIIIFLFLSSDGTQSGGVEDRRFGAESQASDSETDTRDGGDLDQDSFVRFHSFPYF